MGYSRSVRIRCERCATTYELDERRLPAHGALVKCTRCDHVFRAAPPGGAAQAGAGDGDRRPEALASERPNGEVRTALFGFGAPAAEERTAPIGESPPPAPAVARPAEAKGPSPARKPAAVPERGPAAGKTRSAWPWVLVAALIAAALLAGWFYLGQRKAATPTTRLPAGAELFPT